MPKSVKAAALRFLKRRPHSIVELAEKLQNKGFLSAAIEEAVLDLKASGLLDDRAFTNSWINDRLTRPFGFRRIISELQAKGVDKALIDQAVSQRKDGYQEKEIVWELAQRRWARLTGVDLDKKKKKLSDFLLRRGFDEDVVIKILKRLPRPSGSQ